MDIRILSEPLLKHISVLVAQKGQLHLSQENKLIILMMSWWGTFKNKSKAPGFGYSVSDSRPVIDNSSSHKEDQDPSVSIFDPLTPFIKKKEQGEKEIRRNISFL